MISNLKKTVIILFCILYPLIGFTQGRIITLDYITDRFDAYCKSVPREEVYIHTDREDYIAGEEMWFSVYVIDRQSSNPSPYSNIVYFELLNMDNNPVIQKRILVTNGSGPGQVVLPDSLSSGNYTLRAYTNWMRNFLPANCFMKDINIYNTFSNHAFKVKPEFDEIIQGKQTGRRLSRVSEDNFSMETTRSGSGDLEVVLYTNDEFRAQYGNIFYLIIQTHGIINYKETLRVTKDNENDTEKIPKPVADVDGVCSLKKIPSCCKIKANYQILQLIFLAVSRNNYSSCFLFAGHGSPGLDATHCQPASGTFQSIFYRLLKVGAAYRLFRKFQSIHQRFGKVLDKLFLRSLRGNIYQSSQAQSQHNIGLHRTTQQFLNNGLALSFLRLLNSFSDFLVLIRLDIIAKLA